jgi:signal transduction histidine kinase
VDLVQSSPRAISISPFRLGFLLSTITLLLIGAACVLAVLNNYPLGKLDFLLSLPVAALVGGVILARQPHNVVGWLVVGHVCCFTLAELTRQYALYGVLTHPGALPLAYAAAWPAQWLWGPAVGLGVLLPLYFPTGRLPSPRWRGAVWYAVFAMAVTTANMAFARVDYETPGIINPLGVIPPQPAGSWYDRLFGTLWLSSSIVAAISLAVRFLRARGDERQQVKWLLVALVLLIGHELLLRDVPGLLSRIMFLLAFTSPWIAIGIAMLRYRLYDIDVIINRTLAYGTLTALVIGLYILIVGYLSILFRTGGNLAISLVATGVVAVLFQPLRERVQHSVNRLVYGDRDEPYAVVARLGQRLEATTEPTAVLPTTVETLAHALRLPYVAIALTYGARGQVIVEAGRCSTGQLRSRTAMHAFPLMYHGQALGELRVAQRPGETDLSPNDRRLLADLARQIGVAAHAVLLTADLEQARLDVVNEREVARQRLGSDLHDGVGHQLTALARKAETAANLLDHDPPSARILLAEIKHQCNDTINQVRQLAHQLHPPDLELLGLLGALQERTESMRGLLVTFDAPACLPPLPVAVETAAYYIAQEALSNVQRHANARTCHIRIAFTSASTSLNTILPAQSGTVLELELADDGRGLPSETPTGLGLLSMQARAAEIGGVCTIAAQAGGGTLVQARLPVLQLLSEER